MAGRDAAQHDAYSGFFHSHETKSEYLPDDDRFLQIFRLHFLLTF